MNKTPCYHYLAKYIYENDLLEPSKKQCLCGKQGEYELFGFAVCSQNCLANLINEYSYERKVLAWLNSSAQKRT